MRLADVFEGQKKFIASILVFFSLISSTKMTFATAFSTVTPRAKITESIDHRSEDELTQNTFEYTSWYWFFNLFIGSAQEPRIKKATGCSKKYSSGISREQLASPC